MNTESLKDSRKRLFRQILVLTGVCLLIILGAWLFGREKSTIYVPLFREDIGNSDLHIVWENGSGIPVEKFELKDNLLTIVLRPEEPGSYEFTIMDKDDDYVYLDQAYVLRAGTVYYKVSGNFSGDNGVIIALSLFFFGLGVLLLVHFKHLKGPDQNSYDAIAAFGGGCFCTLTGLLLILQCFDRFLRPQLVSMKAIFLNIASAGQSFILLTLPLVLIFSILMIVSNIALLRHERFRIQNVLGIGIGVFLIASDALVIWLTWRFFSGSSFQFRIFNMVNAIFGTAFTYFECILAGAVVCGLRAARHVPAPDQDYILILGCGFRKDGTLPPLLRGRVDKALEFWKDQKEKTGKEAVLVPSGGQGGDEPMPEAEAMSRYMLSCGIPENAVMKEDRSANTYQNMEFSKKLILEREKEKGNNGEDTKVIYTTTNYHVFRSGVWANLAGLSAEGLGSRTKWWFWPNAFIRECVGLLVNRLKLEIVWLIILSVVFGMIAFMIEL